jgi:hypothetical protein
MIPSCGSASRMAAFKHRWKGGFRAHSARCKSSVYDGTATGLYNELQVWTQTWFTVQASPVSRYNRSRG